MPMAVSNFYELEHHYKDTMSEWMFERFLFTEDWFSHSIPVFEQCIPERWKTQPISALEIGSFEGRSTLWMLENILTHPDSTIMCIEPGYSKGDNQLLLDNIKCSEHGYKAIVNSGISQEVLPQLRLLIFDFIYIDGSHKARDVLTDAVMAWPLLKSGGIMAFDDYGWQDERYSDGTYPKEAIDVFLQIFGKELEIIHQGYQIWVKKT
jgi:predicted O-methyltransferase YrrM